MGESGGEELMFFFFFPLFHFYIYIFSFVSLPPLYFFYWYCIHVIILPFFLLLPLSVSDTYALVMLHPLPSVNLEPRPHFPTFIYRHLLAVIIRCFTYFFRSILTFIHYFRFFYSFLFRINSIMLYYFSMFFFKNIFKDLYFFFL